MIAYGCYIAFEAIPAAAVEYGFDMVKEVDKEDVVRRSSHHFKIASVKGKMMSASRRGLIFAAIGAALLPMLKANAKGTDQRTGGAGSKKKPLVLSTVESFYVGGTTRAVTSKAFGKDEIVSGAIYAQRLVPQNKTFSLPLVFIHGGSHSGVTWETTPDGREGWQTIFTRAGFETIVIDQYWRGRSAVDLSALNPYYDDASKTKLGPANMIGKSFGKVFARGGTRFPMDHLYEYASQMVPDFAVPKAVAAGMPGLSDPLSVPSIAALLDRIGPAILVTHSQGGHLGWRVALARPDKVAGIFAVEPGLTFPGLDDPAFPDIPVYVMWGDNLPEDAITLSMKDVRQAREIAARRKKIIVDLLPDAGIRGNGHMMMMEDNNVELAERGIRWLRTIA